MIKKFDQFINENDSTINWEGIEELCMKAPRLPDCVPTNIRQWDVFIRQYERASDLVNGKWEPHYNWNTIKEFYQAVDEQFYLGKGFKNSIYECFTDLTPTALRVYFENVNWDIVKTIERFTKLHVNLNWEYVHELPLLPKKVLGNFICDYNDLNSLKGCPEYVGYNFSCANNFLTSLEYAPKYVGGDFYCDNNKLPNSIPIKFQGKDLHKYIDL